MRRSERQWKLTDFQRFVVVVAGASSFFLAAMSLGMGALAPFLVALLIAVSTGVGVFLLGLRHSTRAFVSGSAHVIRAQPRPIGTIVGRCDMEVYVDAPGIVAIRVPHREQSVPVIKWPRPGMVLPIEVAPRNPRQFRVRWDLVVPHHARPSKEAEEAAAFAVPFFTEYGTVDADDIAVDHLDHHEHEPYTDFTDQGDYADYGHYDEHGGYDDLTGEDGSVPGPATASADFDDLLPPAPGPEADPDTIDGEILDDRLDQAYDIALDDPPPPAAPDSGGAREPLAPRPIPQPRGSSAAAAESGTEPAGDDSKAQRVGIMLFVSDLGRSLRFYRDLLEFTVADRNSSSAVLTYGGGRVVLRRVVDMSPVDRRVVHLHLDVPNVDDAYQELRDKGVEFVHRPRVMSRGQRLELWAATFRDPDGHAIALTQWRERSSTG